jgi:hypothetical protein
MCVSADASMDGPDGGDGRDGGDGGDARDVQPDLGLCRVNDQCGDSGTNVCEPDSGVCVECLKNDDCTATTKPICNLATRMCERCTMDAQCVGRVTGPGICMFHQDGRCATDTETIYVKNSTGSCVMAPSSGGTKDLPYCLSQDGVNAVVQGRSLIVMRGPDALTEWSVMTTPPEPISVVGQGGAVVNPGARIGIRVSAGNVYVRRLSVSGGSNVGVFADGAADLHMNGCRVENNVLGGIRVDGASFDITNTVIAGNRSTSSPGCGGWAGACFNNIAGTPRFLNNTVVSNIGTGIACNNSAVTIVGSIAFGNTLDVSLCTETSCCTGNPMLTADYLLMSGSPCIGKLSSTIAAPDDIDGQLRANGQMNDCGADEF